MKCCRSIIAAVTLVAPVSAADVDVYLFTGQSNMLGTTAAGDPRPVPGTEPADGSARIFWSNVSPANGDWPPKLLGDSGGAFVPLAVQQGDGGRNATFWGPEFGFAREMAARGHGTAVIVKACRGGGGNSLWDKDVFDREPAAGHMWGHLRDTLDAALDAITAESGGSPCIRGLCYLQGESNSVAESRITAERMVALVANVTAHVERWRRGAARGMRVAVVEIAASHGNARRVTTTDGQRAFASTAANVVFVPTADLPLKSDGIHFGGDAKLEIGRRCAAAMAGPPGGVPRKP